jgi:hypothetical protein
VTISATPPASIASPVTIRRRSDDSDMAVSSRIALTGAMRAARLAGRYAATVVTTMPTA